MLYNVGPGLRSLAIPSQNEPPMRKPLLASRRFFVKRLAAIGIAAPAFIRNLRAAPPSEAVRHASFGASGMAGADLHAIAEHKSVQLICVADVDSLRGKALQKDFP